MFGRKKKDDGQGVPDWNAELKAALERVTLPGGDRDVVSLGLVRSMHADERGVKVVLQVGTPSRPYRERLERIVRDAVEALGWGLPVSIEAPPPDEPAPAAPKTGSTGIRRIVAVASGKGGVGKSTVAVNLAYALLDAGHTVGLLDADIYGPSVPHMLGIADRRPETGTPGGAQKLRPIVNGGLRMMSMGFLVEPERAVIWRGPMVHGALKQFFDDVEWGELDYLVVDLPPGTGDAQLTLVQQVPVSGAVIVTTPQDVAMIDARKAVNMFRDTNVPVIGIVENMSLFTCPHCHATSEIFGHGGAERWAASTDCAFLGAIPISLEVRRHGDDGTPAVRADDTPADVKAAFAGIAQKVHADVSSRPPRRRLSL